MDKLEEKMIGEIETLLVIRGLLGDSAIADQSVRDQMKQRQETAFHNTQLFLENYRKFKWAVEQHFDGAIRDITNNVIGLDNLTIRALLDALDKSGDKKLAQKFANDIEAGDKGKRLLEIFDKAMAALQTMPKDGQLYYDIAYYLCQKKAMSGEDIANLNHIAIATFFRMKTKAIEQLSVLMWNTPRGSLGTWAEVALIISRFHTQKE